MDLKIKTRHDRIEREISIIQVRKQTCLTCVIFSLEIESQFHNRI